MIVADTSAWAEFLRATGHPAGITLRNLIKANADVGVTDVIVMELLAGAQPGTPVRELRSRLLGFPILSLEGLADFEEAAAIYRSCRGAGHALRGLNDCLIAVPVVREGAALLHNDRDFDLIASCTGMKVHAPTSATE